MKTNTLRRNSDYHGCHIVERLDSKTKPYRQVYRCKSDEIDSVLVRFILDEVPAGLVCAMDGLSLPIEYFFVDCYQSMYPVEVLPNILSCDFDLKEAWYVREYVKGCTLREEIKLCHQTNEESEGPSLIESLCTWLVLQGHIFNSFLPTFMKYNLTVDNLFITPDQNGKPKLVMLDIEAVLSAEAGLYCSDIVNLDTRFLPPEILCDIFNDKSYVYVFAMLIVCCLKFSYFDSAEARRGYESMIGMLIEKDFILDDINISNHRKEALELALKSNPEERPIYSKFSNLWSKATDIEESPDSVNLEENNASKPDLESCNLDAVNRFDGMFHKGRGNGFADIAGMDELKRDFTQNLIYPIIYPEYAKLYGINPPNGMLLYGPPGCGKSFFAEKCCEEIGWVYAKIKASDLGGPYFREGITGIKDLFEAAEHQYKKNGNTPVCIIIDEADGLIQIRNQEMSAGAAAETNAFLTELETCSKRGIFVIATSNDPRQIDQAALRTGRLGDSVVYVPLPDNNTKNAILKLGLSKLPCDNICTETIVEMTKNFSSSDVADISRISAVKAMSLMISNIESGKSSEVVLVTEDIVRKAIAEITPSLSEDEIARYMRIHNSFSHKQQNSRPKIGFR